MPIGKKFVIVADDVTANEIGCAQHHFNEFIMGKQLIVQTELRFIVVVRDAKDMQWTIMKTRLKQYQWKKETEVARG